MGELGNAFIGVIHAKTNASSSFKFIDLHLLLCSVISSENYLKCSRLVNYKICGFVLISKGMSANNDGLGPARNESWDVFNDDRFSEDSSVKNVSDGSIGTFPHLLEFKLFDSGLIRSNSCAFDANFALLDGFSSLDGDFIISGITMLNTQIKV